MRYPKHVSFLPFLLAFTISASSALAQTAENRETDHGEERSSRDPISVVRSPYTTNACARDISGDSDNGIRLAQLSRSGLMHRSPSHHGYSRRNYQTPWMDHGNAGHALIGAAIGFGLGAAFGVAANADHHSGTNGAAVLIFGGLSALVGGAIGGAHGGPFAFAHHRKISRPPWTTDEEEEESRINADSAGFRSADSHPEDNPRCDQPGHDTSRPTNPAARNDGCELRKRTQQPGPCHAFGL
jgi:hypothetical protein